MHYSGAASIDEDKVGQVPVILFQHIFIMAVYDLKLPQNSRDAHYEGELVPVIGKTSTL
jgi:hypothetical protein